MGPCSQHNILTVQTGNFGETEARLDRRQEDRVIPPTKPRRSLDSRKKGLDFVSGQEVDHGPNVAFSRDREHTLDQSSMLRCLRRRVAEERTHSRKPQI